MSNQSMQEEEGSLLSRCTTSRNTRTEEVSNRQTVMIPSARILMTSFLQFVGAKTLFFSSFFFFSLRNLFSSLSFFCERRFAQTAITQCQLTEEVGYNVKKEWKNGRGKREILSEAFFLLHTGRIEKGDSHLGCLPQLPVDWRNFFSYLNRFQIAPLR